ncbi:DUF6612 family protein [Shouchella clausii]|uniref:DUF6612 family protein n=1 Tax=Shouchella clausii TaxID=79880 RepID=UPI000BA7E4E8|nr:DUF6612 family protein [Shouchella clausii]PAE94778.1 hypothetical protein CHH70_07190 [Shouchella clausii]
MKRTSYLYGSLVVTALLGACSPNSAPMQESSASQQDNQNGNATLNAESIIEEAKNAEEQLNSYTANFKATDTISTTGDEPGEEPQIHVIEGNLAYKASPETFYTALSAKPGQGEKEETELENLATVEVLKEKNRVYTNINDEGWLPIDKGDPSERFVSLELTPMYQLELLQPFSDFVNVSEYDDLYVISVAAGGETLREMAANMDMIERALPTESKLEIPDQYQLSQLDYMLFIDKNSFLLEKTNTVFEVVLEDNDTVIRTDISLTRTSVNDNGHIDIPSIP